MEKERGRKERKNKRERKGRNETICRRIYKVEEKTKKKKEKM